MQTVLTCFITWLKVLLKVLVLIIAIFFTELLLLVLAILFWPGIGIEYCNTFYQYCSMFPLNFLRCARKRTVSEQPILVPEHCNWAIFQNANLTAKSVAAILRAQRRYQLTPTFGSWVCCTILTPHFVEIVAHDSLKITVPSTKCSYILRPFPNSY